MSLFVGDDWAEAHHDVHLMTQSGDRLVARQLPEGLAGIAALHAMIAEHADDPADVIIGIETDRGPWVQALLAAGYQVYAINPLMVARYRERTNVAGAKSDAGDAKALADLVRTDRHNHRPIAGDTPGVDAVKVLARAHQNLIWERIRHTNRLRNALREYYPAALAAFDDLAHRDAIAVLRAFPSPAAGAKASTAQIVAALKRGGRKRSLDTRAAEIRAALRTPQLGVSPTVAAAYAATVGSAVRIIDEIVNQIAVLETELETSFDQHPDTGIYRSLPGLGVILGARVLAEFGDDPERYNTAKSRRNYAGTSPLTVASGRSRVVKARFVKNRRLYNAVDQWAFCSITTSPGCRAFYDQRRAAGDLHHQALRALGNRLVGYLHGCINTRNHYDEHTAWAHRQQQTQQAA